MNYRTITFSGGKYYLNIFKTFISRSGSLGEIPRYLILFLDQFLYTENYQMEAKDRYIEKLQAVKKDTGTRLVQINARLSQLESAESEAKMNQLESKEAELESQKVSQQSDMEKLFESSKNTFAIFWD